MVFFDYVVTFDNKAYRIIATDLNDARKVAAIVWPSAFNRCTVEQVTA